MRYSEIYFLPGTPEEAKNVVMDILTVRQSLGHTEVPLRDILRILHRQNFDIDRKMLIDLIKDHEVIDRISDGIVYIKVAGSEEVEDTDAVSDEEEDKSEKKVEQMAKKALKNKKGK